MTSPLWIFPTPQEATCLLRHDTAGWTLTARSAVHPSGRPGQVFDIPDTTPQDNGCSLQLSASGYSSLTIRSTLHTGAETYLRTDDFHLTKLSVGSAPVTQRPTWDGTYLRNADGSRYVSMRVSGFLDYRIWLEQGPNGLRPLLQQMQDLGARGRRMFPHKVGGSDGYPDFNPDTYGQRYWDEIPAYFAFNADYGQAVDVPVLTDSGYRGWSLGKCQEFWARWNDATRDIGNKWISLTNEWNHGGNLVGSPDDYARPSDPLVSQGSAVSDAPPPRPGWGRREFHVQKAWPKIGLCEDMYFNRLGVDADGHQWGPVLPTDLSEGPRFDETNPYTTEWLSACLAYQSVAFGDGLTFHCDDGKWGRLLQPRQAACCRVAMRALESVV